MDLSLEDVNEEDLGLLGPCGIVCAGCDWHTSESGNAAKRIRQICEGHKLADVAVIKGMMAQDILNAIKGIKAI